MKKYNNQHFISYGDKNFKKSVLRIEREAKDFNSFKSIEVFKNKDFYDKDQMKELRLSKKETNVLDKKNSFINNVITSLRHKINDPLGRRKAK